MTQNSNNKIVAFVGLSGCGKSAASEYLAGQGFPRVYFGGVIYDAMEKAGIEKGEANEAKFRVDIREERGKDFVVNKIIEQIRGLIDAGQKRIVADGIYSWVEYRTMKRAFPGELTVIAIVSPRKLRHRRLNIRSERPLTRTEADQRDWSEIENIQKGGPIAAADYYVINDDDVDNLHAQIDKIIEVIDFKN